MRSCLSFIKKIPLDKPYCLSYKLSSTPNKSSAFISCAAGCITFCYGEKFIFVNKNNLPINKKNSTPKTNLSFAGHLNIVSNSLNINSSGLNISAEGLNTISGGLNIDSTGLNIVPSRLNIHSNDLNISSGALNIVSKRPNMVSREANIEENRRNIKN